MTNQTKRLRRAALAGTLTAFGLALLVTTLISKGEEILPILLYACAAGLSAAIAIHCIWRRAMIRKDTRKRGFWFGVLTGLAAFMIMSILVPAITHSNFVSGVPGGLKGYIRAVLFSSTLFGVIGFALGGFLSLPIGGLIGGLFSRDPDEPDYR